jgi:hypothetical protein
MAKKLMSCPTDGAVNYTQYPIPEALLSPSADADHSITPLTKLL